MMKSRSRGFSTMDILLAASLAIVLLGLAVPSLQSSVRGYRLSDGANQIAAELNAARVLAVSRGTSYRIDFDMSRNAFQIIDLSDPDNPTRRKRELGESMTLVSVPSQPIVFTSRGGARGGTVVFSNANGRTVSVEVTASGQTIVHKVATVQQVY